MRTSAFKLSWLSGKLFALGGYNDLINHDLGSAMLDWNLLDEANLSRPEIVSGYIRWSFSASFLQMINAWQWFIARVSLCIQNDFPAQELQMYYYSTFFSYGSFLSAHLKGNYTVHIEPDDFLGKRTRKEIWLRRIGNKYEIQTRGKSGRGEHETRARWFFEVYKNYELRENHKAVMLFEDEKLFSVQYRNLYTYSLADMTEELFSTPDSLSESSVEPLLDDLWNRREAVNFYPEAFWALEHIRLCLDLHVAMLGKHKGVNPFSSAQVGLVENLLKYHQKSGFSSLLSTAFKPILDVIYT